MKFFLITIMLMPVVMFSQDFAIAKSNLGAPNELTDIQYPSQDGFMFFESHSQIDKVSSPIMMDMDLSDLVIEFESSAGVVGPAQGSGISNGINVLSGSEAMSTAISVGPSVPISAEVPALTDFFFVRASDVNSSQLRKLMIEETIIPHIEVFYLDEVNGSYRRYHVIRYEDCLINSISMTHSEGAVPDESISFSFTRACYRSYNRDVNGNELGQVNTCFDKSLTNQSSCSCGSF